MSKQPHNEHELELSLTRLAGSNLEAVKYRDMMSGVVLGQMLPAGTVVKGGSSLRLRFGPDNSRVTMDFDTARSVELGALEANICKVFDIEGVEDLASGMFSADAAKVNAAAAEGGKVKFTVTPVGTEASRPASFFFKVRMK